MMKQYIYPTPLFWLVNYSLNIFRIKEGGVSDERNTRDLPGSGKLASQFPSLAGESSASESDLTRGSIYVGCVDDDAQ